MPGFDGTGPMGQGARTGGSFGNCPPQQVTNPATDKDHQTPPTDSQTPPAGSPGLGLGRGMRRGGGRGRGGCGGAGRGMRGGRSR